MSDDSLPVEKITISGPTLASILQRFSSSPGDVDGLLFGHFTRLPPPEPNDDDPSSSYSTTAIGSSTSAPFAASITCHFCSGTPMSFYDPVGRIDPDSIRAAAPAVEGGLPILLGWFCGRRRTSLRPSMREVAVSNSLFKTLAVTSVAGSESPPPRPCIFLLLSFSSTENHAIHTYEYRSFHLRRNPIAGIGVLEPRSLHIVNIGPDFRGHYGSFSPESALPWMHLPAEDDLAQKESLRNLQDRASAQRLLASSAEGFTVDQLAHLVGPGAAEYTSELENLYMKMLLKLEGLARLVEKSSAAVLEQENKNLKLRSRLAGLE